MTHSHGSIPQSQPAAADASAGEGDAQVEHGHSMWWMLVCCAPMVLIALAIVFGVFGFR